MVFQSGGDARGQQQHLAAAQSAAGPGTAGRCVKRASTAGAVRSAARSIGSWASSSSCSGLPQEPVGADRSPLLLQVGPLRPQLVALRRIGGPQPGLARSQLGQLLVDLGQAVALGPELLGHGLRTLAPCAASSTSAATALKNKQRAGRRRVLEFLRDGALRPEVLVDQAVEIELERLQPADRPRPAAGRPAPASAGPAGCPARRARPPRSRPPGRTAPPAAITRLPPCSTYSRSSGTAPFGARHAGDDHQPGVGQQLAVELVDLHVADLDQLLLCGRAAGERGQQPPQPVGLAVAVPPRVLVLARTGRRTPPAAPATTGTTRNRWSSAGRRSLGDGDLGAAPKAGLPGSAGTSNW